MDFAALFPDARPLEGLAGGLVIGLAGAILLLGAGRIAGVSGLAARAAGLSESGTPRAMAWLFIAGLPVGAGLVAWLLGPIEARFPPSGWLLIVGGLVTGFGTRMGGGCTSGHGVCGLSRLSPRSIAATLTFIAAGIATVTVVNRLGWGW